MFYESHPDGAVEEMLALTNPSLSIVVDEAKEDEPEPVEDDEGNIIQSAKVGFTQLVIVISMFLNLYEKRGAYRSLNANPIIPLVVLD